MPLKRKPENKIRISLVRRIGDGTNNVNIIVENNGNEVSRDLLRWLTQMDVWNRDVHAVYSADEKFELPKEMGAFLYSDAFASFISKFHGRNEFEVVK